MTSMSFIITGIAIALICLGPVYSELDEASLETAEKALETAKDNIREPYFQYTRLVAQLGRVKQLRDKRLKEAMEILVELKKQTKLPHDHIGEFKSVYVSQILVLQYNGIAHRQCRMP